MREVIRSHPREIILAALLRMAEMAPFYIFITFILDYGSSKLHMERNFLLSAVLTGASTSFVTLPFFGHLSDVIGRRRMYLIGAATVGLFGFVYFALLDTGSAPLIFLAIVLSLVPHAMVYGPQAALIAELFPGRLRYSGASIGYQLASVIAGGPAPLIASALYAAYPSGYVIAGYILVCALVSIAAAAGVADHTGQDI
jgi:MFS family permease